MAYIINKTNGDQLTSVPDGEIDISTSIRLVGKNYPGYGEIIAENLVGMLENFANSVAPRNPMNGQLWYDTSVSPTPVMKCYSSALAAWQSLATVSGSGSGGTGTTYTLPTATATVLGGVKIGAGLTITNGVISASGGGGATTIVGLSDVSILSPTNGQVLKYNSATAKWYNGTDLSGTGGGGTTDGDTLTRIDALENSFLSLDGQISAKANYSDVITLITNSEGATATQLTTLSTSYTNLQSQVDTKASVTQLNTAISNEQQARASAISTLQASFNSLAGGTGATVEYVNNAIASAGFASASSVTTLSTTVSGITSQLVNYSSLESTVNGVTGKWGVKINANGAISGVEMLNDTGGTSFTVAADQFKITGDTPANGKSIFTVDTNLDKITMTGDVVIGGNLLLDGAVSTLKIAGNAVTVPLFAKASPGQGSGLPYTSTHTAPTLVTQPQRMVKDTNFVVSVSYSVYEPGFHGVSVDVILNFYGDGATILATYPIGGSNVSFENSGTQTFAGNYVLPWDGKYAVSAIVDSTSGTSGEVTSISITGLGAQR